MAETADHTRKEIPEWSHFIKMDEVEDKELSLHIAPDVEGRKNLAKRMGLVSLDDLQADIKIKRQNKRVIKIHGSFSARVTQSCVVTLEPVQDHIEDTFEAWFADPDQAVSFARARHERNKDMGGEEEFPMLEEEEDPEPIIDGRIDVGEVVTQYLSLALNPYPHSKEARELLEKEEAENNLSTKENPFAALKALREGK